MDPDTTSYFDRARYYFSQHLASTKIDLISLGKGTRSSQLFTDEEKIIVADFLEQVKSELKRETHAESNC